MIITHSYPRVAQKLPKDYTTKLSPIIAWVLVVVMNLLEINKRSIHGTFFGESPCRFSAESSRRVYREWRVHGDSSKALHCELYIVDGKPMEIVDRAR